MERTLNSSDARIPVCVGGRSPVAPQLAPHVGEAQGGDEPSGRPEHRRTVLAMEPGAAGVQMDDAVRPSARGAASAVMDDRRVGNVRDNPSALLRPDAPVDLLAVKEERLIEGPDIVPCGASDQHAGAERVVDPNWAAVSRGEPPVQARAQKARRTGKELEPRHEEGWVGESGILRRAVREKKLGSGCRHRWAAPRQRDESWQRAVEELRVGVEEQEEFTRGAGRGNVDRRGEPAVRGQGNDACGKREAARFRDGRVRRRVVYHQRLDGHARMRANGGQAATDVTFGLIRHDND